MLCTSKISGSQPVQGTIFTQAMIKKIAQTITVILILPIYIVFRLLALVNKNDAFVSSSQFMSLLPGKTGSYLRNSFYTLTMTKCEQGVVFSFGTLFSQVDTEIEAGTYIGPQCNIGSCKIGQDCLLGSGVHILSGKNQHNIESTDIPIRQQGGRFEKITIGQDTWIGNNSVVMADIGNKCVIAAGSVVVHPVADNMVVAGNPAIVIKER